MPSHLLILNFHGLGPPPAHVDADEARVWLPIGFFAEVLNRVRGLPGVRITFDDGNATDFEIALPELARRDLTAEFFLLAGRLDEPGYLTREQVREMVAAGMAVGTHGMAHRRWPDCDDASLAVEIHDARARLEDVVAGPVTTASCPFGAYDRRSLQALRKAGFTRVYTSDRGIAQTGDWLQARNTLHASDTLADLEAQLQWNPGALRTKVDRVRVWLKSRR